MKIGVFDSGLGGIAMLREIHHILPDYDYVFYGDTLNVPYGGKEDEELYDLVKKGVDFLFEQNCLLVILACNTASAVTLRRLQDEYLPTKNNPDLRILGIIVPTTEELIQYKKVGILATQRTVESKSFDESFARYGWHGDIVYQSCPLLVPLIENGEYEKAEEVLESEYLPTLLSEEVEAIILGCTHYMLLKNHILKILPQNIKLISQDEIIPIKLKKYLEDPKHADKNIVLTKNSTVDIFVTRETAEMNKLGKEYFGVNIILTK